jgi:hypothetical protein
VSLGRELERLEQEPCPGGRLTEKRRLLAPGKDLRSKDFGANRFAVRLGHRQCDRVELRRDLELPDRPFPVTP